jgi:exopolysaccharide biosynthesis polyprenyl glycosylphosphotransferase
MLAGRGAGPERCLVIGAVGACEHVREKLGTTTAVSAEVVCEVPFKDALAEVEGVEALSRGDDLSHLIAGSDIHRVILAPQSAKAEHVLNLVGAAKALGVKVSVLPQMLDTVGSPVVPAKGDGMTVLWMPSFELARSSRIMKRALDLFASGVGLVVLSPVFAMTALTVKADSRGPIFFRQLRVGRGGDVFEMLKFRTMVQGADEQKAQLQERNEVQGLFKIANDPRLTRVGRYLRRISLDELPQLWNVLQGDMSLVGPRPLVLEEDQKVDGWYRRRLQLTPGMTGQWQVLGSPRIPLADMVKIDYLYVANWSLSTDVKILLKTVPHVLRQRGM